MRTDARCARCSGPRCATLVLLGALTVLGVAVGALVAGLPGVWGALLGVGVALIFSATTVWTMLRTVDSSPTTTAAIVMASWLGKMVVLVAVLVVLRGMDFYDRWVFAGVLLVGVMGPRRSTTGR